MIVKDCKEDGGDDDDDDGEDDHDDDCFELFERERILFNQLYH